MGYKTKNKTKNKRSTIQDKIDRADVNVLSFVARLIVIVVLAVLLIYMRGVFKYWGIFLPNTYINGIEVSGLEPYDAAELIKQAEGIPELRLESRGEVVVVLQPIDVGYIDNTVYEVADVLENKSIWEWFIKTNDKKEHIINIVNEYDKETTLDSIKNLQVEKIKSQDAQLMYLESENKYTIKDEVYGLEYEDRELFKLVTNALDNKVANINIDGIIRKPTIKADNSELQLLRDKFNRYLSVEVTYDFGGRRELVTADMMKDWFIINGTEADFDIEQVKEYQRDLSDKYDTFGTSRDFNTSTGKNITVGGGSYGWMIHITNSAEELISAIKSGVNSTIEPVYSYTALIREADEIGNSYIEIDLDKQHLWVYIDGVMKVDTDLVSGNISKGHGTKTGVYPILYKERNATLNGQGYSAPVNYWIPFDTNVGLHDATWRSEFGSEIYKYNGSHGCVNLPYDKSEQIYELAYVGMPVIIY